MIKATLPLRQDRLNLDDGVESAEQCAVLFETLTIQREGVREDRLAQLCKLVERDIPRGRINRSEFLVLQGHYVSPVIPEIERQIRFRRIVRRSVRQSQTSQTLAVRTGLIKCSD